MSKSKKAKIHADTNKTVAVLEASARQIAALPKFVPNKGGRRWAGEYEGKEVVAENASQMVTDFTKGNNEKMAKANLEVAKIDAETNRVVRSSAEVGGSGLSRL